MSITIAAAGFRRALGKAGFAALLLMSLPVLATNVRLQTTQGAIDITLLDAAAPITVANFLAYVKSGAYNGSFFHRSERNFVIQGGGFTWDDVANFYVAIPSRGPILNEFSAQHSNLRGTIAMAKLGGDPNSATSQWFINLADNGSSLDGTNGGYTVFGQVSTASMTVVDAIAALQIVNADNGIFSQLPLTSLPATGPITKANLALVQSASVRSVASGAIDIDGSGRHNILLRNASTPTPSMKVGRLVNSQFQFTAQEDPGAAFRLVAAVDLDGNGKSDLVFLDTTQSPVGDVRVWPDFVHANERLWRSVKPAWDVQVAGDLDGDGAADLVWRFKGDDGVPNDTGVSYVWFNIGTPVPAVRKRGGAPLDWQLLGAADFNADGAADMVYVSPANDVRVLMATANRTCANISAGSLPTGYRALKLADFSSSGRADIFMRNPSTGQNAIRQMNAVGMTLPAFTGNPDDPNASCTSTDLTLAAANFNLPATDPTWQFYAAGDFNGDGYADIAWLKPDGTIVLWLMGATTNAPTVINSAGSAPAGYTVFQAGGGGVTP